MSKFISLTGLSEFLTKCRALFYTKPNGGVPKTDLAQSVQTSLGKADSAYQKPNSGIPKTDLASGVQSSLDLADSSVQANPVGSVTPAVDPYDYATREELSQLGQEVNGGEGEEIIPIEAIGSGIRVTNFGSTTATSDVSVANFPVIPGETYELSVPSVKNAYSAAYAFQTEAITAAGRTITLPDPAVVGPATNAQYQVTIPTGKTYLLVSFVKEAGTPTLKKQIIVKGLVDRIETLEEQVESLDIALPEVVLPPILYAVAGDRMEVFWRGIIKAANPYNYDIVPYVSKGKNFPRKLMYDAAVGDIGEVPFKVEIHDCEGKVLSMAQSILKTVAAPSSPASTKKVLCFGASTTAGGQWPAEAARRLTASGGSPSGSALQNIQLCGALSKDGAGYFGVGGWTWANYATSGRKAYRLQVSGVSSIDIGSVYSNNNYEWEVLEVNVTGSSGNILIYNGASSAAPSESGALVKVSGDGDASITFSASAQDVANPLWDGTKVSFIPYANTYAGGQIDAVYFLLGNNGIGIDTIDFSVTMGHVKTIADTLHAEFPNAKLYLLGLYPPSTNGGLGYNYGANGNSLPNRMGLWRSQISLNKAYAEFAADENYSSFVEYVDTASQFDSEYNYPYYEINVNTRSTEKERIDNNGIHPANAGYYQIADVVYRHFVAKFCQSN